LLSCIRHGLRNAIAENRETKRNRGPSDDWTPPIPSHHTTNPPEEVHSTTPTLMMMLVDDYICLRDSLSFELICGLPRAQRYYSTLIHIPYIQYACLRLGQGIVRDCRHIRKHSLFFSLSQAWSRTISTAQLVHLGDGAGAGVLVM
jgi:hypothetical protein